MLYDDGCCRTSQWPYSASMCKIELILLVGHDYIRAGQRYVGARCLVWASRKKQLTGHMPFSEEEGVGVD